ncbi:MAG: S24 family peptidase [Pseudomonadota bacterium]
MTGSEENFGARLRASFDGNVSALASATGLSDGAVHGYLKRNSIPRGDAAVAIADHLGVSLRWLLTGEEDEPNQMGLSEPQAPFMGPELAEVPRYDVQAAAGNGTIATTEEPGTTAFFPRKWLRDLGLDPDHSGILDCNGDSMEPTISDGAPMVVNFAIKSVVQGGIYVISLDGAVIVKRVERLLTGDYQFISDNPKYPPQTITQADIDRVHIVGMVRVALQAV